MLILIIAFDYTKAAPLKMLFNLVIITIFIQTYHMLDNTFHISSPTQPCKVGIRAKQIEAWVG